MIDYLSDTVTQPTDSMREAMFRAKLGDDGYGEDPSVNELESLVAGMMGKEASVFVSSGTLGNLTSILAHCPRGHEAIMGDQSDLYNYEAGGVSVVGGVVMHPVATENDGSLSINNLQLSVRGEVDDQCAPPGVIVLENPHCLRGGRVLPLSYLKVVHDLADSYGLPIHMDGARIFNASVALNVSPKDITQYVDSVQFCLSKSLAAPFGSLVCGKTKFTKLVRRYRKMLGGGMRQAGIMASAGIVALHTMVDRLADDHRRAADFAEMLREIPTIKLDPDIVETNMVFFTVESSGLSNLEFLEILSTHGVRMGLSGQGRIRAVIHYMINDSHIEKTIKIIKAIFNKGQ